MGKKNRFLSGINQLAIPLVALGCLILFNLIRDPGYFAIKTGSNVLGHTVLSGNIISVIDGASELAIIAMGMTLVTAACGGQDISVGSVSAISGSIFVCVLQAMGEITIWSILIGFAASCIVTILFKLFNGTLVAVFKIQPMIATLILFSCARSIAYWISGDATPQLNSTIIKSIGLTMGGIPIPTPVLIVAVVGLLMFLVFKLTNLRLYTQSVGINQGAARLNGINPTVIKLLSFVLLGVCVAVASMISVCRMEKLYHQKILIDIEMDAILAVAIGGNSLGGGRFRMVGSILGAYVIQMLTSTLLAMRVSTDSIKAYKAIVIILIVMAGSPVVKREVSRIWNLIRYQMSKGGARA